MDEKALIEAAALLVTALGIVLTVIWRTGTIGVHIGTMETKLVDLRAWVEHLSSGQGPVCSRHTQQLGEHDRRLDNLESTTTNRIPGVHRVEQT